MGGRKRRGGGTRRGTSEGILMTRGTRRIGRGGETSTTRMEGGSGISLGAGNATTTGTTTAGAAGTTGKRGAGRSIAFFARYPRVHGN